MHWFLTVFVDCTMYMSARRLILERLNTKSQVDFYVHLIFYAFGMTLGFFLGSHLDPNSLQNAFESTLQKPFKRDNVPNLNVCIWFHLCALQMPSGPSSARWTVTGFSLRLPCPGVRKVTTETPSDIPTGLAASRHPPTLLLARDVRRVKPW